MRPRTHNILSYSVTLLVFWAVSLWRTHGAGFSLNQSLGAALWTMHFARRTLESAFVHRYSRRRVGPGDYSTEYVYYWGFAAWIAWSLAAPAQPTGAPAAQVVGVLVFVLGEAGNARAHLLLRSFRPAGSTDKSLPHGFLFEWVSCPHYLCEILSWVGFNLVTQSLAGVAFMTVGAGILGAWAHTRHVAYRREFTGEGGRELYPTRRRALVPYVF